MDFDLKGNRIKIVINFDVFLVLLFFDLEGN